MEIQKKNPIYKCVQCVFYCDKKSDITRHLRTKKHCINILQKGIEDTTSYKCYCGKKYKERSGLWKHQKKCIDYIHKLNEEKLDDNVILELIKENKELRQMLIEQNNKIMEIAKEGKNITNNSNNTNNFNLNIFLNEKCKDAINIMDFVSSLHLQLNDLQETAKLGYVEGISRIFIKGIKELDIYKRPIHCSDFKRETLYIKDKDIWEKEDKDKSKISQAIKYVGSQNIKQIPIWVEQNPQCKDHTSKKNDEYMNLLFNTMLGVDMEEQTDNINKVIKNVSKEVIIDKQNL